MPKQSDDNGSEFSYIFHYALLELNHQYTEQTCLMYLHIASPCGT